MIGRIAGTLLAKSPPMLLVDVAGVGYELDAPMSTFYRLPAVGEPVLLHTHLLVREDAQLLYGFASEAERALFRQLLKVSGVGAKLALVILSGVAVDELLAIVVDADAARLVRIPGIGRKTAERLILELREPLGRMASAPASVLAPRGDAVQDAASALEALGYKPTEARAALRDLPTEDQGRAQAPDARLTMAIERDGILRPEPAAVEEVHVERGIRPGRLADYVGQQAIREQLDIFIGAAQGRKEAMDHVLLYGPPGLGKTTLAHIIAHELGVGLRTTSGPVLERPGDLAAILTNLAPNDVLFVDEIHRLSATVEEVLYPALEDFQLDIMIGEGPAARSIKLDLPPFTLIGATTRAGLLTSPLRDRFGIVARLEFYTEDELTLIVQRAARLFDFVLDEGGAHELARRSRGTPRIANRLLRRARDYAQMRADGAVTRQVADAALAMLGVDQRGLDGNDRRLLSAVLQKFGGGPVGVDNLAAAIGETRDTIEDVIEPYLIQQGLLMRTPRGRVATQAASLYLGLTPMLARDAPRDEIFDE